MKSSFRKLVIFISCSVCALGDLEIYPGINFEDQNKNLDISDDPLLPIYNSRRAQAELELDQKYFGMPLEAFRNRLTTNLKAMQKEIISKQNAMKAKALNAYKHMSLQDIPSKYHKYSPHDYGNANLHNILGDVARQDSDFTFRDEDTDDFDDNFVNNYGDQMAREPENDNYERSGESYGGADSKFSFVTEEKPVKFAVAPPDPRFYAENPPEVFDYNSPQQHNQRQTTDTETEEEEKDEEENERKDDNHIPFLANFGKSDRISEVDVDEEHANEDDSAVKIVAVRPNVSDTDTAGVYIIAVVAGISAAATVGLIAFGIGWYK
nr:uncharacterized protein LOC111417099 isoform X1 [Onthophagus taurus]XP_022905051.1 uncharacterized protein LOC111417099 isoform X2 [Onthophagus taurus]